MRVFIVKFDHAFECISGIDTQSYFPFKIFASEALARCYGDTYLKSNTLDKAFKPCSYSIESHEVIGS